jgi:chromosome segregation ATPase
METLNTYRGLLIGMVLLFGGSLIWLLLSRNDISRLHGSLDQAKLKHEALLAEKLEGEKRLNKMDRKFGYLEEMNDSLDRLAKAKENRIVSLTKEKIRLSTLYKKASTEVTSLAESKADLTKRMTSATEELNRMTEALGDQKDSVRSLRQQQAVLETSLQQAVTQSMDNTLVIAEKSNGKVTSKAKRARELMAEVELPSELGDLKFTVEKADGSILSDEGLLTAREVLRDEAISASTGTFVVPEAQSRRMQVLYVPAKRLKKGVYVFKIWSAQNYVGSMKVRLD